VRANQGSIGILAHFAILLQPLAVIVVVIVIEQEEAFGSGERGQGAGAPAPQMFAKMILNDFSVRFFTTFH